MSSRAIPSITGHGANINMRVLIMCLVLSTTTLLFLFLIVSLIYLWFHRFKSSKTTPCDSIPTAAATNVAESVEPPALRPFSYRDLRVMTDCFHPRNELGRGGSGTVFRGRLRDGKSVAVKRLELSSLQAEHEYQNEIQILGSLRSPNVVSLLGYCADPSRRALVYEFMPNRSLQEVLFSGGKTLRWSDRYRIVLDVAKALCFLHRDCNPPVIHGDIKPSNILLGSDFVAKLADFGISRVRMEEDTGFEFFSQEMWKSQELEKSSQMNSETDFGFPPSTTKLDSGTENLSLKGKEVPWAGDNCKSDHSKEWGANDLEAQVGADWWWKQEDSCELESRDYVMEWIGSQIYPSGNVQNSAGDLMDNGGGEEGLHETECEDAKKVKKRKMKEWWKEEYFMEMKAKRNRFRRIEERLKRLSSARLWQAKHYFDHGDSSNPGDHGLSFGRRSWRRKKNQSRCDEMWSGDPFSKELSSTTSMRGTVCYVAPEYGGCGYLTEKGDVYSFGVLVLVVVSGRRPLHISSSPMELQKANLISWARQLAQTGNVMDLVDESLKNEYNKDEAVSCINLALLCLQRTPELRPDSDEIVPFLMGESELPDLPVEFSPSPAGKTFNSSRRKTVVALDRTR